MMKNLLLSSFFLLLIGCTPGHYGLLEKAKSPLPLPTSIFGDNFNSFLFKTNISIYGKEVSGLLVTKQIESHDDYRVIFTTELGMKLFDFEFKDTLFTLHYCVPQFNRPALLKTIQMDMEILLMTTINNGSKSADLMDKKGEYDIKRIEFHKMYNYYFREKTFGHIVKIEHSKKRTKKVEFLLTDYQDNFPAKINIRHFDIKLKIELIFLKR